MVDQADEIHEVHVKKKARFLDNPVQVIEEKSIIVSTRANEKIFLHFELPFGDDYKTIIHPEYTHQLFNEEKIEGLYESEAKSLEIHVHINTNNLLHEVALHSLDANLEVSQKIKDSLALGIPPNTKYVDNHKQFTDPSQLRPIGKEIHRFQRQSDNYLITLASHADPDASLLVSRLEKVAMWFIETADAVDFTDSRWEVVFLYQKHTVPHTTCDEPVGEKHSYYSFVGYMTLYTFHNPFQGSKIRVCQALVFPIKQNQGLGKELLTAIYQLADQREDIVEITVEDPSPGFQQLRDIVDIDWLFAHTTQEGTIASTPATAFNGSRDKLEKVISTVKTLDKDTFMKILKLIAAQITFLMEFCQYLQLYLPLLQTLSAVPYSKDDLLALHDDLADSESEEWKSFRLQVKRNCIKIDPELKALPREEMQDELSSLFEHRLTRYLHLVYHLNRKGWLN